MRYEPINAELFMSNRQEFVRHLSEKGIAIFNSCDIYPVSADTSLPFQQHTDIFYLSGIDQEESILLLFPTASDPEHREILFIKKTDNTTLIWEGQKLTKENATKTSGIQTVYWLEQFPETFKSLMEKTQTIYLNKNEHRRFTSDVETREDRFIKMVQQEYPSHTKENSGGILNKLRSIKKPTEIELIKQACQITKKGFDCVLQNLRPGIWEFEIEAMFSHEFIKSRATFAYQPIIASGANNNVLHYINNNNPCQKNELVLMDVGARYANYCSDVTRTYPTSGKFTERQKEMYQAVLNVKTGAEKLLTPNITWEDYKKEVTKITGHELVKLKLINKEDCNNLEAIKAYFPHGISHHLGLDTHDYGSYEGYLKPGMVLTVEPGIYIQKEGFGIRLEDDLVIQKSGPATNLTSDIPIDVEEIEDLMK